MSPDDQRSDHQRIVQRDLVVVGASAGGVETLQELAAGLPPEFPAAVLVVLHVAATGTSVLPQILSRRGALPAAFPKDGDPLERGRIYVAPPDHHLLVRDDHVRVTHGPRENGHRPAIDPLFRSAGRAAGPRSIGVVLSGLLDDGAAGLHFLKEHGGIAVVQDPAGALFPSMPIAAIAATEVDRVVPIGDLAGVLCQLVGEPIDPRTDVKGPRERAKLFETPPTTLTCPECGGSLWELMNGNALGYTCQVGHAYSLESLFEEQGRSLETVMWSALRSLEERADVQRRLASRATGAQREALEKSTAETQDQANALRDMLGRVGRLGMPPLIRDDG